MSIVSANWNQACGNENKKTFSKSAAFGNFPINNNYVFFKNGSWQKSLNANNIPADLKNDLDKYRAHKKALYPIPFTEQEFEKIYYSNEDLTLNIATISLGSVFLTPTILGKFFGIPTDTIIGLMASIKLYYIVLEALGGFFYSSLSCKIPKNGVADLFSYKRAQGKPNSNVILSEIIHRNILTGGGDDKLILQEIINLSTISEFEDKLGQAKFDSMLSKAELLGGSGYTINGYKKAFRKQEYNKYKNFINNLKNNTNKKYQNVEKWLSNYQNFENNEKRMFETSTLNKDNFVIGGGFTWKGTQSLNLHIDFTDYYTDRRSSNPHQLPRIFNHGTYIKNPGKEKSVFGPYFCRSKGTWLFFPKIYIASPTFTTNFFNAGYPFFGGIICFNAFLPIWSPSRFSNEFLDILLLLFSGIPLGFGVINPSQASDVFIPTFPPLDFPLGSSSSS
jgi:uncharacterized protein YifE (UPF0438 family)